MTRDALRDALIVFAVWAATVGVMCIASTR